MSGSRDLPSRPVLLILLLLFAAGCRAAPPVPPPPQPLAGTTPTEPLNLILWHSETGAARDELEALARDFHAAYPNLNVTPQYVGDGDALAKQVTAAIALSRTPDLVLANRRAIAQFVRQGGLRALDQFRTDASVGFTADDNADLFPGLLDEGFFVEFNKQFYAVPFDLEGLLLFYNADLLKASSYARPPAKWDEFADMASKVTQDQQYGWAMQIDADVFSAMLASQGSAMLDNPERRSLFDERGGVAAMTMVSQLTKAGAAKLKDDREGALNDFAQGHAAFYLDWMTELSALKEAQKREGTNFEIGVSNLPQADPTEPFMLVRGLDFAIFRTSPDRERNAWFFLRWITASRQAANWARAAGAIPVRASALSFLAADTLTNARLGQIQDSFGGTAPQFVARSANRHAAQIEHLMEDAWAQIVLSKADVVGTLTAASGSADQLLAGNP
jgi:ABC-type glycerol-3-phosphate transport system substrate-binding protein